MREPSVFDHYIFKYTKDKLAGATSDQIVAFYVDKFVFRNEGYLEHLQAKYELPNDFLKLHEKICKLAEVEASDYQGRNS